MTLMPRVLLGKRGASFGLFVSKANKNVLTAGDDDLLISPLSGRTNLTFLSKGTINLRAGAQLIVLYYQGTVFPSTPLILTQTHRQGVTYLPPLNTRMPRELRTGRPPRFRINAQPDRMTIFNLKSETYVVQYLLVAQPADD